MIGRRRRLRGSSVATQVWTNDGIAGRGEQRRNPVPRGVRARMTVQQQDRRAVSAAAAVQGNPAIDIAIPLRETIKHDLIMPRPAVRRVVAVTDRQSAPASTAVALTCSGTVLA